MRILYFDCIAGISGDMALGALIQAGADADVISERLSTLPIEPFEIEVGSVDTHGIHATKVTVHSGASAVVRTYANIRALLEEADLPADAKALAQRIFRRLAEAEGAVHNREVEQVAFHEVGAVDSIVDITGTALALTMLGVERMFASAVPTGFGMVKTEHGMMPIPAPAVVELLRGVPMYSRGVPMELVTPTGAAILASTVEGFGELPRIRTEAVGYGAGTIRQDFPNVLRVIIGEDEPAESHDDTRPHGSGETLLETNIDDLNPELYPYVLERLFEGGAQDAWLTPIVMKKGRPAVTVSVLCSPARAEALRQVLFRETGTLGVRASTVEKAALERGSLEVRTGFGDVRVKLGVLEGVVVTASPEFEDCVKLAREAGVPARDVYEQALRLAREVLRDQAR
ncbi:MAG: pyridinium-3,5-bisthiocarboxylic acid mononucleotide nickel chelatase [Actinomycetota bacterium]|nr:pyridinium-3,5-bisthiocarboxylic acid mononucleotide nickel chelatase [Actinomycetota bacterium]